MAQSFYIPALAAANRAGIVLIASAGNGASQVVQSPAGVDTVLAVGATDNADNPASFTNTGGWVDVTAPGVNYPTATCLGCGLAAFVDEVSPMAQSFAANGMTNSAVASVAIKDVANAGLACSPLAAGSLTDKIALMQRGICSFATKVSNAEAAGAVASIVSNNSPGNFFGTLGAFASAGPAVSISQEDGATLAGGPTTANVGVAATDYWFISGTSFSSPTVAGIAALIKQVNPDLSPVEVHKIITQTAEPIGPQVIFGKGMVRADRAVDAAN
jgi:subtilisin family serine protease